MGSNDDQIRAGAVRQITYLVGGRPENHVHVFRLRPVPAGQVRQLMQDQVQGI